MQYTQICPPLPTMSRWVRLCRQFPAASTLRRLEYEHLATLNVSGRVLDVGGGNRAKYLPLLSKPIEYSSVNIDPAMDPTWVVNVGQALPTEDHSFDCCLSLNTLEHVYEPSFLIREMYRSLKPGGVLHVTVPWMFRIHGHPDDFTRATPSWWGTAMNEAGFSDTSITPLIWGRWSTGAIMTSSRGISLQLAHAKDVFYSKFFFRDGTYGGARGERICSVALGHFISARK